MSTPFINFDKDPAMDEFNDWFEARPMAGLECHPQIFFAYKRVVLPMVRPRGLDQAMIQYEKKLRFKHVDDPARPDQKRTLMQHMEMANGATKAMPMVNQVLKHAIDPTKAAAIPASITQDMARDASRHHFQGSDEPMMADRAIDRPSKRGRPFLQQIPSSICFPMYSVICFPEGKERCKVGAINRSIQYPSRHFQMGDADRGEVMQCMQDMMIVPFLQRAAIQDKVTERFYML
mgnify:CR=1 FL=1